MNTSLKKFVLIPSLTNTPALHGPIKSTVLKITAMAHASEGKTSLAVQACIHSNSLIFIQRKKLHITVKHQETQTDHNPVRNHHTSLLLSPSIFIADNQCITEE